MEQYLTHLKEPELDLVREVEQIQDLEEDNLIELHQRVRRARNKHTKNYRRRAARRVEEAGARGAAKPKNAKARLRAEAFEELLSRVSARLAVVAHEAAEELKAERLAQAQEGRGTGPYSSTRTTGGVGEGRAREHETRPGNLKLDASSQAQGARRQAKRDSR